MKKQRGVNKFLFALGELLGGGSFMIISLLYAFFLTDVQLMDPKRVALLLLIGKMVDGAVDPFLGWLSDHTKSRFGRRRPYFLFGILPVFITFTLLWSSFQFSTDLGIFMYYLMMYCLFSISYSTMMVPYNAILPDMVQDYDKRTSFMGARMLISIFSSLLAAVLPSMIVGRFGDIKTGYMVMAAGFGLLYALPWLAVFFTAKEQYADTEPNNMGIFKQAALVFQNRTFRYYIFMFLFGMAGSDVLTTLAIYYLSYVLGIPAQFTVVMGILMVSQLIGSQIWTQVAKRTSKHTPIKIGVPLLAVGMIIGFFLQPGMPVYYIYTVALLMGLGGITCNQVPWSVLPDVIDVGELITGHRQEGVYSGMVTFVRQLSQALMISFATFMLGVVGYVNPEVAGEMAAQSPGAIMGIRMLFCLTPILLMGIAMVLGYFYPMARKRFDSMCAARTLLRAGKPLTPELLPDVLALTGVPESKLWGGQAENFK